MIRYLLRYLFRTRRQRPISPRVLYVPHDARPARKLSHRAILREQREEQKRPPVDLSVLGP